MIGQFCDIMIVESSDKSGYNDAWKSNSFELTMVL